MKLTFNDETELLRFNLKYYRYKRGLSQEMLAEKCDLHPTHIADIERGKNIPTFDVLDDLALALNVKVYQLFQNPERDSKIINLINNGRQYNQNIKR